MAGHCTKRKSKEEYDTVMKMHSEGIRIVDIVKITGLKRGCVSNWIHNYTGKSFSFDSSYGFGSRVPDDADPIQYLNNLNPIIPNILRNKLYSYILGLYLGDGYICKYALTKRLCIAMDAKYHNLNSDVYQSIYTLMNKTPSVIKKMVADRLSSIDVGLYSCNLGLIFPHEGIGLKHLRKIELQEWQKQIIEPVQIVRGLIFSDGCYFIHRRFNRYEYSFTNCSLDIINILKHYLGVLNIKYNCHLDSKLHAKKKTPSYILSICNRESVEKLHTLIGDKNNPISCFEV